MPPASMDTAIAVVGLVLCIAAGLDEDELASVVAATEVEDPRPCTCVALGLDDGDLALVGVIVAGLDDADMALVKVMDGHMPKNYR